MLVRLLSLLVIFGLLAGAQKIPPGNFAGKVHGVSKKEITLETEEGNLVDFSVTRKTVVKRGPQAIKIADLQNGEEVAIEAKQEMGRFLTALTITAKLKE